jgi:hypothetical protein
MEYKCKCNDEIVEKRGVVIRHIETHGVINDIKCEKCGNYMEIANPKSGMPNFGSTPTGQVR